MFGAYSFGLEFLLIDYVQCWFRELTPFDEFNTVNAVIELFGYSFNITRRKIRLISWSRQICERLPGNDRQGTFSAEHSVMLTTIFSSRWIAIEFEDFCPVSRLFGKEKKQQ